MEVNVTLKILRRIRNVTKITVILQAHRHLLLKSFAKKAISFPPEGLGVGTLFNVSSLEGEAASRVGTTCEG